MSLHSREKKPMADRVSVSLDNAVPRNPAENDRPPPQPPSPTGEAARPRKRKRKPPFVL